MKRSPLLTAILINNPKIAISKSNEVITFCDIGQEILSTIPAPDAVRSLNTYGRSNQERQKQLQANYPQSKLLSCQSP